MRYMPIAVVVVLLSSCSIIQPAGDDTVVRVKNESSVTFSEVVLDLGHSESSRAVFRNVPPSSVTKFVAVEDAFHQPFTVHAEANGQHFRVDAEAAFALPLEPGSYTYTLWIDEESRLRLRDAPLRLK